MQTWGTSEELARLISSQLPTALDVYRRDPDLFQEHVGLESSFRTSGYSDRQVTELIQNASDAILSSNTRGNVEIVLTPTALYCANEGMPFTAHGIKSITHAYISTKRGQEIGRYGLGFKSVLALSESVQIYSKSVSFEFGAPDALEALRQLQPDAPALPVLRTPTLIDPTEDRREDDMLNELLDWATTVIRIPLTDQKSLRDQLKSFSPEFLLFAPTVARLRIRDLHEDESSDVTHVCEELGDNRYRIDSPGIGARDWLTCRAKHAPSPHAKAEVAESIARDSFYITYAAPLDERSESMGTFWANFPLESRTSARGIFNAPWALNEDRTNILSGKSYNTEILYHFVQLFLDTIPLLRSLEAPARHLRYMPSRIREVDNPVDRYLITNIHQNAAHSALIPTIDGKLVNGQDLRALDHSVGLPTDIYHLWAEAPHTPKDFPHPDCYDGREIRARLRELHRGAHADETMAVTLYDKRAPSEIGIATWLTMLSDTDDPTYSTYAIKASNRVTPPELRQVAARARMVATLTGERVRLGDSNVAFLPSPTMSDESGEYVLIHPSLMRDREVVQVLRAHNFKEIAPETIMDHFLQHLDDDSTDEQWDNFWKLVDDVPIAKATAIIRTYASRGHSFKVIAADDTWASPEGLFDLSRIGINTEPSVTLQKGTLNPQIAIALGVVSDVDTRYPVIEENLFKHGYVSWAEDEACATYQIDPDDYRGTITFDHQYGAGPIGLLERLDDPKENATWTRRLLDATVDPTWKALFEDGDSAPVRAPHEWAILTYGVTQITTGEWASVNECVDPALARFSPVLKVPIASPFGRLSLPRTLDDVSADHLFSRMENFPARPAAHTSAQSLGELAVSGAHKFVDQWPSRIPAILDGEIVPTRTSHVYVAKNGEEVAILDRNRLPYVLIEDESERRLLIETSPLLLAERAIRYEIRAIEPGEPVPLAELFPGIRAHITIGQQRISIVPVQSLVTRQTTPAGTTDEEHDFYLDGDNAYTTVDPYAERDQSHLLHWLSQQVPLNLGAAAIDEIVAQLKDVRLAELKNELLACTSDADRIAKLFDANQLRIKLPAGLIESLQALGKELSDEDLPNLLLDAYGYDSLSQLRDQLSILGFGVPSTWAGSTLARQFVTSLGFPVEFAGERSVSRPTSELILGKPGLGPLHDYQETAVKEIRFMLRSRQGNADKALVELPTGAGKTRVAVEATVRAFLQDDFGRPGHVLWVAQSKELCEQAITSWSEVWREFSDNRPLTIHRFYGTYKPDGQESDLAVVVATDAMLREHLDNEAFDWVFDPLAVIVDEAHRAATSTTYTQLLRRLGVHTQGRARPLLGLSATPFSGRNAEASQRLADRFGRNLIQTLGAEPIAELQSRRILAEIDHEVLEGSSMTLNSHEVELRRISTNTLAEVGKDERRTSRIVHHILALPSEWKVLVFMPSVLSAQVVAAILRSEGVQADSVSGESSRPRRDDVVDRFKHGDIQVLVNCDLLTQGFDAPKVRALYIARPTLSDSNYIQMVGRGLRGPKNNGSERCLIVDLEDTVANVQVDLAYRDYQAFWSKV